LVTRVYAGDGRLMAEYAIENRVYVPISAVPKRVINAFLSSEDKTFYSHSGIDIPSIVGAAWINLRNLGSERRPIGASTITQQVAKNFLLTNEISYQRKVKEAILSLRIERAFSKDRILELYLNHIYLGSGNYGVASAAINYFNKSLDELSIGEAAYLAGLPKAPNEYSLKRRPTQAKDRRDWVIDRMLENRVIDAAEAAAAKAEPLIERARGETELYVADYFAEEIRREIAEKFTEDGLYKKGLVVRATIEPRLQEIADQALRRALVGYDRAQGYRGPLKRLPNVEDWQAQMASLEPMPWLYDWRAAMVISAGKETARIGFQGGEEGQVPLADRLGAGRRRSADGPSAQGGLRCPAPGDLIAVAHMIEDVQQNTHCSRSRDRRRACATHPHTGRVLAADRRLVTPASSSTGRLRRAPGSAFKPIVSGGTQAGYTLDTHLDAPIVINRGPAALETGELRAEVHGSDDHAARPGDVAQSHDHPHGPDTGHGQGGGNDREAGCCRSSATDAGDVDRRRRDDGRSAGLRLWDDCQRRQEDHADFHRPGSRQPGLDPLSPRSAAVRQLPGRGV
jgi:penicillin-binding protein 1A